MAWDANRWKPCDFVEINIRNYFERKLLLLLLFIIIIPYLYSTLFTKQDAFKSALQCMYKYINIKKQNKKNTIYL